MVRCIKLWEMKICYWDMNLVLKHSNEVSGFQWLVEQTTEAYLGPC